MAIVVPTARTSAATIRPRRVTSLSTSARISRNDGSGLPAFAVVGHHHSRSFACCGSASPRREVTCRKRSSRRRLLGVDAVDGDMRLYELLNNRGRQGFRRRAVLERDDQLRIASVDLADLAAAVEHRACALVVAGREDEPVLSAGCELCDRTLDDDAAVINDRHRVAGLLDLVEEVRGNDDGAAFVDEAADHAAELEDAGRVEPVHRLVEDQ